MHDICMCIYLYVFMIVYIAHTAYVSYNTHVLHIYLCIYIYLRVFMYIFMRITFMYLYISTFVSNKQTSTDVVFQPGACRRGSQIIAGVTSNLACHCPTKRHLKYYHTMFDDFQICASTFGVLFCFIGHRLKLNAWQRCPSPRWWSL